MARLPISALRRKTPAWVFTFALACQPLLASTPVMASVTLVPTPGSILFVSSEARIGSVVDLETMSAPGLGFWQGVPLAQASDPNSGASAGAVMSLGTAFNDSLFTCTTAGSGFVSGSGGSVRGGVLVAVQFVVNQCQQYAIGTAVYAGTYSSARCIPFIANLSAKELALVVLDAAPGQHLHYGRLSPGSYMFYVENTYGPESVPGSSLDFSTQVVLQNVPVPLIQSHPANQTVSNGATTTFNVGVSGQAQASTAPAGTLTYRWRRNLVDLFDGGRISGAATSQLVITNTQFADSGFYDVVVTQDSIVEPSSLAKLDVTSSTSDVAPPPPAPALAMDAPSPSPFSNRTTIRCSLPRDADVQLDVLDVNGRLVKRLLPLRGMAAGAHAVDWSGDTERGDDAPAGIYFIRLRSDGEHVSRRVVRLGSAR